MNVKLKSLAQPLMLTVPASAAVQQKAVTPPARLLAAYVGERVVAWTQPAPATLKAELDAHGTNYRLDVHPATSHGFSFPSRDIYHHEAAEKCWSIFFDLCARRLKQCAQAAA